MDEFESEDFAEAPTPPLNSQDRYWGRLYPASRNIKFRNLVKDRTTVGKAKTDICISINEVPNSVYGVCSRTHFSISRIESDAVGAIRYKVVIEDLSMNGTYVNAVKVKKGEERVLIDDDVISIGKPQFQVFYYKSAETVKKDFPKLVLEKYDISQRLGCGAFGEVYLIFDKINGKGYAMKTMALEAGTSDARVSDRLRKLGNELKILRKLNHPHVIKLLDEICYMNQRFLILELMEGKDLYERIADSKRLTEPQSKLYFYQILCGLDYLHRKGIVHRDLKPENVLLATRDVDTLVKITDFGLSKLVTPATFLTTLCGTKMYVAPEVLESGGRKKYTGQVDVWSLGVILFVCLSGQTPFSDKDTGMKIENQIKKGRYEMSRDRWECVSTSAKKLIKRMMTVQPEYRILLVDVFKDPWLEDASMKTKLTALLSNEEISPNKENVQYQDKLPESDRQEKENIPEICFQDSNKISELNIKEETNVPNCEDSAKDVIYEDILEENLLASPKPASLLLMPHPESPIPRKRARHLSPRANVPV